LMKFSALKKRLHFAMREFIVCEQSSGFR
jgi:hypothetical protein